ncbi:unnamed protein product [Adineta steineri]|uniref:Uncharacterized protein n=1 Tax=Adineta steineri TaxID=433720 RepID=A0A819JJ70_9BILA|nr:unnamed protein product [Adineta steineri]CAF3934353.1 unnamed protein product [Adineta steineri]
MFFIGISIPFIGILLILIFGLSNTRYMFSYYLSGKRKKRHSINITTNNLHNSFLTIQMHSILNNIDNPKCIPNVTTIISLEDDEELMKCDISSNFCDSDTIELRLEQDLDSDNELIDN